MYENKRKYPRLDISLDTRYRVLESLGEHAETVTKNISERGICIPLDEHVEPGTRLEITITIPNEPVPVQGIGQIAWVRKNESTGLYEAGIELVHIKKQDRDRLWKYAIL